jgi:hypothetical protein
LAEPLPWRIDTNLLFIIFYQFRSRSLYHTSIQQRQIFNAIGESLTEIAVPISAIETLRADEILAVSTLAKVS